MPEIPIWDMLLHSINEMCVDLIQHVEGEFIAGLAIGAGGLADRRAFSACRFASQEGREAANRLATGAIGRLNLMARRLCQLPLVWPLTHQSTSRFTNSIYF